MFRTSSTYFLPEKKFRFHSYAYASNYCRLDTSWIIEIWKILGHQYMSFLVSNKPLISVLFLWLPKAGCRKRNFKTCNNMIMSLFVSLQNFKTISRRFTLTLSSGILLEKETSALKFCTYLLGNPSKLNIVIY